MMRNTRRPLGWLLIAFATFNSVSSAQEQNPAADSRAVVVSGQARFTVLTPQLLRVEWSATNQFEDHASLVFLNRRLPVPEFRARSEKGWLLLDTGKLRLKYKEKSGKFAAENLAIEVELNGKTIAWHPGMPDTGNLRGTTRTLDGVTGATSIEPGLISRDGWVVVDDTDQPLFDTSDWPWVMPRPKAERQDWYFFGYGHDYKNALGDFTRVAGKIPLPPRFAFGAWWSRYWAYRDVELKSLVQEFDEHHVPLDVLVVDMDWHPTFGVKWWENKKDQSGHTLGWTGYTWNKTYFPDPPGFLKWVHEQGLRTTLNLHPASGVQPHEEDYPAMARAMGIDPASQKYVPFDIASKKFTQNYFDILHHPKEKQGVDFWWLDWQQEDKTSLQGVNPTWWLNYVHFTDKEGRGERGMLFHRWGGLGNHRYQIGFSGDTSSTWDSLAFQPFFTATAANVGYAYWSHDIGGHMSGPVEAELYTRWVQWGAFSPILRTHVTKNPAGERRIWAFPLPNYNAMRAAFLLRYALIPYIYTEARKTHDTGVAFLRPLYYEFPEAAEAYEFKDQYMFGDDLLVAPITSAVDSETGYAKKSIWIPAGEWMEWSTGTLLRGPAKLERSFALDEIPVYVRSGAIIPMQPEMRRSNEKPVDPLILNIFPGAAGLLRLYEDEGNSLGYQHDAFAWTAVKQSSSNDGEMKIEILPTEGTYPGMPAARAYEIRLVGFLPPESVTVDGAPLPFSREAAVSSWRYDGNELTTVISLSRMMRLEPVEVIVKHTTENQSQSKMVHGFRGKLARLRRSMDILNTTWPNNWSPDILIDAVQAGNRISLDPRTVSAEIEKLDRAIPQIISEIEKMEIDPRIRGRALAQLAPLR
ncbi:MAG: DUF5110 domain-containing protein [Acidobacteria bacterium]|nr:DUF5110 domain-containing protein [Acidobacteriota bacterium]